MPITITLIGKDVPMSVYLGPEEQALKLLAEYANEVSRVTPAGTDVVVLPEKDRLRVSENSLPQIDAFYAAAGSRHPVGDRSADSLGGPTAVVIILPAFMRGMET